MRSSSSFPRGSLLLVIALAVLILTTRSGAQQPDAVRQPANILPAYVAVDDQLFDVAPDLVSAGRVRAQGATIDSEYVTGNQKFGGWDAGVIPIEFASDVPQSHRDQYMRVCNQGWGGAAYVLCVPRTSQNGYLRVTEDQVESSRSSSAPCFSVVGQPRRLTHYENHLGDNCWADSTVYHEQGHAFGFIHEHQRPDRDNYVFIDTSNMVPDRVGDYQKLTSIQDPLGPYDFMSIMHYTSRGGVDPSKPVIIPRSGYGAFANTMGTSTAPTANDRAAIYSLYNNYFRQYTYTNPVLTTRFDRTDFLDAMERLHNLYYSRIGLVRSNGLSINGKPDFLGIATWIFDVYLGARSRGFSQELSFSIVFTDITRTDEWRQKHPGWTSGSRSAFTPLVSFGRNEFLDAMQRLDAFYAAPEGLQRPNGLSIQGGPDFQGIATWIFDVYLNDRLNGTSATAAWNHVVSAIRSTDEWRSKH